jgi:DNA-binding transcriptional MocR family regulator
MFAEERRKTILSILTRDGRVEVIELANRFHVSEDTIRRDLRELAALGFLQKTHGGAVALDVPSLAWEARSQVLPAAKANRRYGSRPGRSRSNHNPRRRFDGTQLARHDRAADQGDHQLPRHRQSLGVSSGHVACAGGRRVGRR